MNGKEELELVRTLADKLEAASVDEERILRDLADTMGVSEALNERLRDSRAARDWDVAHAGVLAIVKPKLDSLITNTAEDLLSQVEDELVWERAMESGDREALKGRLVSLITTQADSVTISKVLTQAYMSGGVPKPRDITKAADEEAK